MQLNFDANQHDPSDRYEVIPAGDYEVMIVESEQKYTKNGDGSYLQLTLEIQSGQYQGRKLFDRLNLDNANRTAVEIAQRQLSQICHAVGVLQPQDSEDLHYKPLIAKVKVRPPRGDYDASNEIGGYKQAGGDQQQGGYSRPLAPYHSTPHTTPQRTAQAAPAAPQQAQKPQRAAPPWAAQGG